MTGVELAEGNNGTNYSTSSALEVPKLVTLLKGPAPVSGLSRGQYVATLHTHPEELRRFAIGMATELFLQRPESIRLDPCLRDPVKAKERIEQGIRHYLPQYDPEGEFSFREMLLQAALYAVWVEEPGEAVGTTFLGEAEAAAVQEEIPQS
ncbi:hypothetical protein MRY87_03480, partial [bacterium]|nr:hypothetical protein [bacterium]